MSISSVNVTSDVYMVCLAHALSTEKEEIMGLLIGEIDEKRVSHISALIVLRRSDKQPDRVEISPEQLSDASTQAERLAQKLDRPMRVLGWYHSHPHITVWPSHVDVRTQAMYQMLDEGFVGLIFSVFNQDKATKNNRIQVTCFQSVNQSPEGEPPQYLRMEIPLHIVPIHAIQSPCLESLVQLPTILSQEEDEIYQKTTGVPDIDIVTKIHNSAVYTKSQCRIMQSMSGPLMQTLENRRERNKLWKKELEAEKEELIEKLRQIEIVEKTPPLSPNKVTSV